MAKATDKTKIIEQNLIDAGCDASTIEACMEFVQNGCPCEMVPLLKKHRDTLLTTIHTEQAKLDCLDYLIFQLYKL